MSGTETHTNSGSVDPNFPQETVTSGGGYLDTIYRQSSPHGDDIAIIKAQIQEDMDDLQIFTARVEAEEVKISKQTQILLELNAELEMLKRKHQETTRQLLVERDVQRSFESLSQELASCISPSMSAPGLMKIHSSSTDDALSLVKSTMEALNGAHDKYSASISELKSRLGIESACSRLFSDRKLSLEMICGKFRDSMERKRLTLSSKRLPTEILIQIFDMAVDWFIQEQITYSNSVGGHPALNIALVCQRWHDITMATARLWRYIPIAGEQEVFCSSKPLSSQQLREFANQSKQLFFDLTGCMGEADVAQRGSWSNALGSIVRSWESMEGLIPTILSINYCGEPITVDIPFKRTHTYSLYNIYPIFSPSETTHVTSLHLHFRSQPSLPVLVALLRDLQNLTNLDVLFQGVLTRKLARHATRPSLKRLGVRLSMVPLFFSGEKSVSRELKALTVHADTPFRSSFLNAETWHFTVESCGLGTGLQYLALDGGESLSRTREFMLPLLWGLESVVTLALRGPFLGPILDKLSKDQNLLPSLHYLDMCATDIDQSTVEGFLDSRRDPREATPAPAPIRKLVLDHCSNITRDFCDHVRGKVEELVVYC